MVEACGYGGKVETLNQFAKTTGGLRPLRIRDVRPLNVTITFILKDNRRHDWDNLLASFKAGIDGIVDAGLLPDDDVRSWSPTLRYEQGATAAVRVELSA